MCGCYNFLESKLSHDINMKIVGTSKQILVIESVYYVNVNNLNQLG